MYWFIHIISCLITMVLSIGVTDTYKNGIPDFSGILNDIGFYFMIITLLTIVFVNKYIVNFFNLFITIEVIFMLILLINFFEDSRKFIIYLKLFIKVLFFCSTYTIINLY